ncbi:MAG TPA: hypothetical protein VHO72_16765 [Bacteroidales bacterium]|nr:hypothetical protein [Bacteroidales bacterium]
MNLPIGIAEKLILLQNGEKIPSSKLNHSVIDTMLGNGILEQQIQGRSRKIIFLRSPNRLNDYLKNHFGINSLYEYVSLYNQEDALRGDFVTISSNSKLRKVRTFKGFLVNSYAPVQAALNNEPLWINPVAGCFPFIYDFECFSVLGDITIVGVENPENFRYINKQKHLFQDIKPLFVSRYPQTQNKDLIKWLQSIPNHYLHFGDFDFAGIAIYLNEYKKYLGDKATFFVPENIKDLLKEFGNKELYDYQKSNFGIERIDEIKLSQLVSIIQECKRGLEQEVLIKRVKL